MEQSVISPDVLARYAGDAALEVEGVAGLAESALQRDRAVAVATADGATSVTVHLELEWGSSAVEVARAVQLRVAEYLERMASLPIASVDVVVERVGAPPARQ